MYKNEIINRIFSNTIYKNKLKMDQRPKCRTFLLEKNKDRTFFDIDHSSIFLGDPSPRVMETKTRINILDLIKSFCAGKEATNKKTTYRLEENISK